MAYSNWGAFVHKNGERQRDKEDVPVFGDPDVEQAPSGSRIFVNLQKAHEAGVEQKPHERCHHAVLGKDRVRLCAYKAYPVIFIARDEGAVEQIGISKFRLDADKSEDAWDWYESLGIGGEVDGFRFQAWPGREPDRVHLELIEPDGTAWSGVSGYCMGAGWDDDD